MKREDYNKKHKGDTQDERLLETPEPGEFLHTDTWRVFRIMGEFVEGFDDLATLRRGETKRLGVPHSAHFVCGL